MHRYSCKDIKNPYNFLPDLDNFSVAGYEAGLFIIICLHSPGFSISLFFLDTTLNQSNSFFHYSHGPGYRAIFQTHL